ncbi:hydrolase [bacterium]|nr:MAG: hydrolase [bacterium]
MRFSAIFLLLMFCGLDALADGPRVLKLKKTPERVTIDGVIDPAWSTADSADGFTMHQPYHNVPSTRRTVAKILTTDQALFCMMVCYDQRDSIQVITGKLDNTDGDYASIMIDTFLDKRTAYKFGVTASGARSDCRLLDDARDRDYSWDGVWFSAAKVYDWGYVIEWEIPYRSIQYDQNLSEWGLDFDRWMPTRKEDTYWCTYEEVEGQRISKFGKLRFEDFRPTVKGNNLEFYPVGITRATYLRDGAYKGEPDVGLDVFYNPSQKLTFQLTANPDFAQIEADPFQFNITRYETYFSERRPFFTEGNEIFMPSGRDRSSGFYKPLELFYSRRIGKRLPDGSDVPLQLGAKAFGRLADWEYGGFLAMTGEKDYAVDGTKATEPKAYFGSVRLKRQILDNSSIGLLFVGKHTPNNDDGVLDIDGAFRGSDWQLSYQLARSFNNQQGGLAASTGLLMFKDDLILGIRSKYIEEDFDADQVGYVPWKGTGGFTVFGGPRWYFKDGYIKQILIYSGFSLNHKKIESYVDHMGVLGYNMQFRDNWGFEVTFVAGRSKDRGVKYDSYEFDFSNWYNVSPKWYGNWGGSLLKTYNFSRDYLAYYYSTWSEIGWHATRVLDVGTMLNVFVEGNPDNKIEDITYNARPFVSVTPLNDLNIRIYLDNVYVRSTKQVQQMIFGFLFSYSFLPKSWIYLAVNEVRDRSDQFDQTGRLLPNTLHARDRVSVLKVKYLYYF